MVNSLLNVSNYHVVDMELDASDTLVNYLS